MISGEPGAGLGLQSLALYDNPRPRIILARRSSDVYNVGYLAFLPQMLFGVQRRNALRHCEGGQSAVSASAWFAFVLFVAVFFSLQCVNCRCCLSALDWHSPDSVYWH